MPSAERTQKQLKSNIFCGFNVFQAGDELETFGTRLCQRGDFFGAVGTTKSPGRNRPGLGLIQKGRHAVRLGNILKTDQSNA
jgi:hypothetical protein